jgi:mercuric reductase
VDKFDLAVIGAGTAGVAAAIRADELGVKTALINAGLPPGGTSLHWGCIPSKHLIEVARALQAAEQPHFRAIQSGRVRLDLGEVKANKEALIRGLREHKYEAVLESLTSVQMIDGWARLRANREIDIGGRVIRAERIIVATGASPRLPPFEGLDKASYLTSRDALSLEHIPLSLLVMGAGPTGLELAQLYSRLGSVVTIFERGPRILPRFEPAVSEELRRALEEENIEVHCGATVKRLVAKERRVRLEVAFEDRSRAFETESILLATGQQGNTEGLGLREVGVGADNHGFISVNDYMETSAEGIYAAGDVSGEPCLETAAAMEGRLAASNAFGPAREPIDLSALPLGIYTSPEVASVGLTEEACREAFGECRSRTVPMSEVAMAVAAGDTRGLLKLVVSPEERIAGVHIVCRSAVEIIQAAALAIRERLTVDDLIRMPHVYPSYSHALKLAAQSFRRDIERMTCCIG